MGCSKDTQQALIDAGQALVGELLTSAAQLLVLASKDTLSLPLKTQSVGDVEGDMNQLVKDLERATEAQFLSLYKYPYNGPRSVPLDLVPGGRVTANEDFVMIDEGDTTALTNYVDNTILGAGSGLPTWFTNGFTNDLLATMSTLVGQGDANFQYETFQNQYTDPSGNLKPISVNAILTYASASITTNSGTASKSIIYFVGVYYNSSGWTMVRELQAADPPINGYPIIRISIATSTIMVGAALAVWILRLPVPVAPSPKIGIAFVLGPLNLTLGLFKWPWTSSSRDPDFQIGAMSQDTPIDPSFVESALSSLGYSFDVTSTTSTSQMTGEITILLSYGGASG